MDKNIISYLHLERDFLRSGRAVESIVMSDRYREISGSEFYEAALAFAEGLYERGIWNRPVVVLAEQRLETPAMFLGTLLSGNYYVPLAEDLPEERVQEILGKLQVGQVYTYDAIRFGHKLPAGDLSARLLQARSRLPEDAVLYVVFTSGSTGKPKGIVKSHRSMAVFLESYCRTFSFSEQDVLAGQTPFCFDASAKDFYLMLKYRMDFHIIDREMFFRPLEIVKLMNRRKVTVLQWVPSALSMLSRVKAFDREIPRYLRKVFFVGETFPAGQLRYWREHLLQTVFVNLYGASEMAGVCCSYTVPEDWDGDMVPIGKALYGQEVFLLEDEEIVRGKGKSGEICVCSGTLAQEYLDAPEESREKFVSCRKGDEISAQGHKVLAKEHETSAEDSGIFLAARSRYYRTGDLAEYDEEGNLRFLSRKDFQIKHMGHRIELGAVESAAECMEGVDRAGAVFTNGRICLYYEGSAGRQQVQAYLKETLQPYMVPRKIARLVSLPLNRNGKIDRMALQTDGIKGG